MVQGTMSNVGKSIIATGLCRILAQDGYRVAPFKSQNMALNSFVTADGGEMGRAQVVQAEACGLEPVVAMNPILLKPVTDAGSQVIVNGRARATMTASEYFVIRQSLVPEIMAGYETLARSNDVIVIEGAGSPAEINLRAGDIVNMGLAKLVDAPVLLVGDIDRGGVFAQLVGTCVLLPDDERERIHGLILNKFRGDATLLADGLSQLRQLTGKPTLGVVPYLSLDIDDEDSLSERLHPRAADPGDGPGDGPGIRDIAVIRLPKVSNFTDFTALGATPGLAVRYVDTPQRLGDPELLIIPGTRNTIADLRWLRETGLDQAISSRAAAGRLVLGICGGYQMLGQSIADPDGVEGGETVPGLGLLPVLTRFQPSKHQTRVSGTVLGVGGPLAALSGARAEGYEIHLGESMLLAEAAPFIRLDDGTLDGCWQGSVCGSYLHGFFDSTAVRQAVLAMLGLPAISGLTDYARQRERQYDQLADALRASLDIDHIYRLIGVNR
jgi:adenosylcobyric acid synthase